MSRIKLPRAVQEAADRADEILKTNQDKIKPEIVPETPAAPAEVKPETPPAQEVKPIPDKPIVIDKTKDAAYWEHRFKTFQGISDAEKNRLQSKVNELDGTVQELNKKLTDTVKAVPKEYDIRKYFSEAEVEAYGEDMMKAFLRSAAKLATEAADERVNSELPAKVKPLEDKLQRQEQETTDRRTRDFFDHLTAGIPDWAEVNQDMNFHQWLDQVDPFTGSKRQVLLTSAEQARNSGSVIAIFKAYLEGKTVAEATRQQRLESKVVPDSIPSSSVVSGEVAYVSRSEINAFYKRLALAQRNRPANQPMTKDELAMEAKIQAAYKANRIT